jgi:hypothetical protein
VTPWSLLRAVDHVLAKCPHRLGEFHAGGNHLV